MFKFKYVTSIPGYIIKLAETVHFKQVHKFLHKNFNREETMFKSLYANSTISREYDKLIEEDSEYLLKAILDTSPCLIAIHESSQKIVGVQVSIIGHNPKKTNADDAYLVDNNMFRTTFMKDYLNYFDEMIKQADVYGRFPNARSGLEFYAIAVCSQHQRRGLSIELSKAALSLARSISDLGFIYAICTSEYSKRSIKRIGVKSVLDIDILNYKDAEGRPMFQDTVPNNIVSVMVLEL